MPEKLPKFFDKLIETISTSKEEKDDFSNHYQKFYHPRNKLKITI